VFRPIGGAARTLACLRTCSVEMLAIWKASFPQPAAQAKANRRAIPLPNLDRRINAYGQMPSRALLPKPRALCRMVSRTIESGGSGTV